MSLRIASLAVLGMTLVASAPLAAERNPKADAYESTPDGAVPNRVSLASKPLRLGSATIRFGLAKSDRVEIKVYDVRGRVVRDLVNRRFEPGEHEVTWDRLDSTGRSVSRGLYFTQVSYGSQGFIATKKLMIIQ
jgi:hypothetical protein